MKKIFFLTFILLFIRSAEAQTWGTLNTDVLVPMNTSTPGTTITTAILNAGTVSSQCTVGSAGCNYSSAGTGFTVGANQGTCSNLGPVQMNGTGGTLFSAQSLNSNNLAHDDSSNGADGPFATFAAGKSHVRIMWCFTSGLPQASGLLSDVMLINNGNASQYYDVQLENVCPTGATNVYGVGGENNHGSGSIQHPNCIVVPPAQGSVGITYFISMDWDITNGVGITTVFTPQGTVVGSSYLPAPTTTGQAYSLARIFSNESAHNTGTHSYYQNLMWEYSSTLPSGTATFTNGSTTVTWVSGNKFVPGTQWGTSMWRGYFFVGAANGCTNASGGAVGIACPTVMNPIGYCQSDTVCTLSTAYTGTTGTQSFTVELPLFWPQTDLTAGVLPPSRAANWPLAGVVGGIPSASYTQCVTTACNAVTSAGTSATAAQVQTAWSSAPANSFISLVSGTYTGTGWCLSGGNNIVIRGQGANNTIFAPTSANSGCGASSGPVGFTGSPINLAAPANLTLVSGMVNPGSTTVTLASGGSLSVGGLLVFDQLDSTTDNGALLTVGTTNTYTGSFTGSGNAGPYTTEGEGQGGGIRNGSGTTTGVCTISAPANCNGQQQYVTIMSCNGVTTIGTSCAGSNVVVGFAPPLAASNWSAANSMAAWGPTTPATYVGIEDMTVDSTGVPGALCSNPVTGIFFQSVNNGWAKGVAILNTNQSHFKQQNSTHITLENSYLFGTQHGNTCSYGTESWGTGFNLIVNNIFHGITSPMIRSGPDTGTVYAYNFTANNYLPAAAAYNQNGEGDHTEGGDLSLFEGNITNWLTGDTIHGTTNLVTYFRNVAYGLQPACYASGSSYATAVYGLCSQPASPFFLEAYHRFYSAIGNVLQNTSATGVYNGVSTSATAFIVASGVYNAHSGSPVFQDANVAATQMMWGNADNFTGYTAPRFNCSEAQQFPPGNTVFTSVNVSQFNFATPCLQSHTIPASFYYSTKPSWWPSGKSWPIIGPDVTSGNLLICTGGTQNKAFVTTATASSCTNAGGTTSTVLGGLANSNPAMDCYLVTMNGPPNGVTTGPLPFSESACYTPAPPPANEPTCDHATGIYNPPQTVSCSDTSSGAIICYTLDGSTPATNGAAGCTAGTLYSTSLVISVTTTLKVIAGGTGFSDSLVNTYTYTMRTTAANPSCSPGSGTYTSAQTVTCTDSSTSSVMCYTTNGTTPATNGAGGCTTGTLYSGTITVSVTETLKIIAGGVDYFDSSVVSYSYTIKPFAANPSCSPGTGTYVGAQSVTCTDSTGGAIMCYTLNGTTPATNGTTGCTTGTLYTVALNVAVSETLKIIAGGTGLTDSSVVTYIYTILALANNPSCSPITGAYSAPLNVNCSDTSSGTVMCYTLDGSTPATNGAAGCTAGTLYSGTIVLSVNTTLNIIAGGTGYADSSVVTYIYTINGVVPVAPDATIFALTQLQKGDEYGKQKAGLVQSGGNGLLFCSLFDLDRVVVCTKVSSTGECWIYESRISSLCYRNSDIYDELSAHARRNLQW